MRTIFALAVAAHVAAFTACDLTVPDYNNADLNDLQNNPTRSGIATAATGLLVAMRDEFDDRNGYVSLLGIVGRESYNFDGADPRFITEMLEGSLDPASPAFGANLWGERYRNIRQGDIILNAVTTLDAIAPNAISDEEEAAIRGFTKTLIAHELLLVVNTRDSLGAVISINPDPLADPEALVTRDAALAEVAALLDEAKDDLEAAGGSSFPFPLSSGFAGFNTPATFVQFNRALKARVSVYRGTLDPAGAMTHFTAALSALDSSFYTPDASAAGRDIGVYHSFATGSGDNVNELFDPGSSPDIVAHPSIFDDAELLPGEIVRDDNTVDLRYQRKIRRVNSQTQRDLNTDLAFSIYGSASSPMPIIRNEELILLRAEAELGLSGPAAAVPFIDIVRTESGGLLGYAGPLTVDDVTTELLHQKRYSLLFEGGHRWIDLRRYGRLDDPALLDIPPPDPREHQMNRAFPIPEAECLARGVGIPCSVGP